MRSRMPPVRLLELENRGRGIGSGGREAAPSAGDRRSRPCERPLRRRLMLAAEPWYSMWEAVPRYHHCWASPCAEPLRPRIKLDLSCRLWAAERHASSSLRRALICRRARRLRSVSRVRDRLPGSRLVRGNRNRSGRRRRGRYWTNWCDELSGNSRRRGGALAERRLRE